jgi:hypothetical protein
MCEQLGVAAVAAPAGDVPGNEREIARLDVGDAGASLDDLGHALVSDRKRRRDGRAAQDDRAVDVAGRRGHGPDDRVQPRFECRIRALPPLDSPLADIDQLAHRLLAVGAQSWRALLPLPRPPDACSPIPGSQLGRLGSELASGVAGVDGALRLDQ